MYKFFHQWFLRGSDKKTTLIKYIEINSFLYMLIGLSFCFFPTLHSSLGIIPMVEGREIGFLQVIGFTLFLVGYFYYFGARTHKVSICLATVFDRLILVPLFLGFIVITGTLELGFALPFLILDPILALGALYCWQKDISNKS
ncbi:MAG: hypothetical protein CMG47_01680 [Candidatus Marinimicrobia bacterium]|nr:hypothetical protein [Candidatus Neomarinimicrobiota bacterium]|tara:strand:+ start:5938 stop:6366 length:429 start_codon:yes stop_codon:yes gene_type:complete